ncbi:MAG TPA: menaquinol-cytochrome c reductase cytochrome b subunit, partial [Acidimicrobiales bacterium]
MTEVPEHLLRRSAERRAALGAAPAAGGPAPAPDAASGAESQGAPETDPSGKIPAHLLARSQAATEAAQGAPAAGAATAVATAPAPAPVAKGPEGHTQRLLTVVKAGSIQDVKATPTDKVHTWPHLLLGEFIATLVCSAFLLIFSAVVNAPLLASANFNFTPNPSKAPWYFLGLQELLTMFHPMVAGVTIPGIGIFALMLAPYADKNPSIKPEDRKFAVALFTLFIMFWAVLVIIG